LNWGGLIQPIEMGPERDLRALSYQGATNDVAENGKLVRARTGCGRNADRQALTRIPDQNTRHGEESGYYKLQQRHGFV